MLTGDRDASTRAGTAALPVGARTEVHDDPPAPPPQPPPPLPPPPQELRPRRQVGQTKREERLSVDMRKRLGLRKQAVAVSLGKRGMNHLQAR